MQNEQRLEQTIATPGRAEQPASMPPVPEKSAERVSEVAAPRPSVRVPVQVKPTLAAEAVSKSAAKAGKSETLQSIEGVMEDHLAEVYKSMSPAAKIVFRQKGEVTAREIETLMYKVKLQTKKIFQLLFDWLKIIPGVNRFFLEQEAKLKTDELMALKETMDKRSRPSGGA